MIRTQPQSQQVTDSLINNDCVGCNGAYNNSGVGTKGELWTYGFTQWWNKHFQDSIWGNAHQFGINNHVHMIMTEHMNFEYGNGVNTGIQRGYRLNYMDDFNAIHTKDTIPVNAWDPQGAATRIDSNQAIVAPIIYDTALLRRMHYLGRAGVVDTTNLTTAVK